MKPIHALYALALVIATPALAQTIYRSTDAQGNPVYSDEPHSGAKSVELPQINTTPAPAAAIPARQAPAPAAFQGYQHVAVDVLSSIPNGLAPTTVGIVTDPPLQPGHHWQLSLDGAVVAQGEGSSTTLDQISRGNHQFSVQIIDQHGSVVGQSDPKDVFVFWPSKNR